MKRFRLVLTAAAFTFGFWSASNAAAVAFNNSFIEFQQQNLIGTVTAIDAANAKITVKTDGGDSVSFSTNEKTIVRRALPGQTSIAAAEKITFADVKVGDRVLVPGGAADAKTAVRQVVVMASEAIAAKRNQQQNEWQTCGVNGRITAVNQEKSE